MTKEEAAKWAELYKAYADGKVIQYRDSADAWSIITNPSFESVVDRYRVKPEMKKSAGYRVYLWEHSSGVITACLFHEGNNYETELAKNCKFKGWVHTSYQYAEFEEE